MSLETASGRMTVHSDPHRFNKAWPSPRPATARSTARNGRRERREHHLATLTADLQHPVAVLLAEVVNAEPGGL